jgi:hypothetical protein
MGVDETGEFIAVTGVRPSTGSIAGVAKCAAGAAENSIQWHAQETMAISKSNP